MRKNKVSGITLNATPTAQGEAQEMLNKLMKNDLKVYSVCCVCAHAHRSYQ